MGIKYIDGDIEGKLLQSLKEGEFQSESDDESIFYFNEDIGFIEKELSIYGYSPSANKRRESVLKNIKPILGMGLRAALKRLSGYMSPSRTLKAREGSAMNCKSTAGIRVLRALVAANTVKGLLLKP